MAQHQLEGSQRGGDLHTVGLRQRVGQPGGSGPEVVVAKQDHPAFSNRLVGRGPEERPVRRCPA